MGGVIHVEVEELLSMGLQVKKELVSKKEQNDVRAHLMTEVMIILTYQDH